MSNLQRSFAKAKLAGLPFDPPLPPGSIPESDREDQNSDEAPEDDELRPLPSPSPLSETVPEDDSSSASSASSASSTGTIRPEPRKRWVAGTRFPPPHPTTPLSPLPWHPHFAQELYLPRHTAGTEITHHVYLTPPGPKGPLFITHHGAGSSGLSFAVCASEIRTLVPGAGVLSVDARGHGGSVVREGRGEEELDLRLETLAEDLVEVVLLVRARLGWEELPGLVLVGHSLGGAVVVEVAKGGRLGGKVLAYAVLDVVEGSAIEALQSMQSYLSSRPKTFPTLEAGIEWHIRSRTLRHTPSARVSVPSLLYPTPSPKTGPSSSPSSNSTSTPWASNHALTPPEAIPVASGTPASYSWRTDLAATQPFWHGWFDGLSAKFLSARGGKLLLLAGTDRLDTELMVGQMQGKYQLQVFPEAGHFIHEDLPAKTAMVLVDFWKRNDGSLLVLPPKVGAMKPGSSALSAKAGFGNGSV